MEWPYFHVLVRLGLALFVGLLAGLERARRAKEAGMRTFAFASLLGCIGGLLGQSFALAALGILTTLVVLMNLDHLRQRQTVELTTSAALMLMGFAGILCGLGHTLTPAAIAVITTAMLAWKTPLSGFSLGLTESELRAVILFALLAFVIYPALPQGTVDPWGTIEPRAAWITVLLLAGISFVNYVLWKIYGSQGVELTGFLGGLVNSTVTVSEMAAKVKTTAARLAPEAFRGILLATAAMLVRNAALLLLLAPSLMVTAALPLSLMLLGSTAFLRDRPRGTHSALQARMELGSPFSLASSLRFGLVFLVLQVAGVVAHRLLGEPGVYATAVLGGLVSSASAVAALAAMAAKGVISAHAGGNGAVLACLASALMNLPLMARSGHRAFGRRVSLRTGLVLGMGLLGLFAQPLLVRLF
jgi:uncharacterized membrane protein (DUF4010 family)